MFCKNQGGVKTAVGSELSLVNGNYYENKVGPPVIIQLSGCESASLRVCELRVCELRVCELRVCELRVCELRVCELRVCELRVASLRVASLQVASLRVYGGDLLPRKRSLKCNFVCVDELILYFIL